MTIIRKSLFAAAALQALTTTGTLADTKESPVFQCRDNFLATGIRTCSDEPSSAPVKLAAPLGQSALPAPAQSNMAPTTPVKMTPMIIPYRGNQHCYLFGGLTVCFDTIVPK